MRAVGIILAGGNSRKMQELTHKRAVAAMPIAGSYRSIDFALSSMTNSHIQNVAVLTQYNSRSSTLSAIIDLSMTQPCPIVTSFIIIESRTMLPFPIVRIWSLLILFRNSIFTKSSGKFIPTVILFRTDCNKCNVN